MVRTLIVLCVLMLTGCATISQGSVYEVRPPDDPNIHVTGYDVIPRFTGYELTFGIPALSPVPIIGPYLAEAIRFRVGKNDIVITPRLAEDRFKSRRFDNNEVPPPAKSR
jgi:hypothetical protein